MKISEYLNENNVNFEFQKTFTDCKHKLALMFDFYLTDYNTIVEFDGIFHYKDIYGGLEDQQMRDEIKNKYCYENDIPLVRIPYYEFDKMNDIINNIIHGNIVPSASEMV